MNQQEPRFEDEIMTAPEVAKYLKMCNAKIYYMIQRKEIPHIRIGKNVRIRKSDLIDWLNNKMRGVN